MKRFVIWFGLGVGLTLGGGAVYAFSISEAMRLVTVGIGAFLLAALTIGGTALLVNRQWTKAMGAQSHRTTHNHRYPAYGSPQPRVWEGMVPLQETDMLPPALPTLDVDIQMGQNVDDEVVA